MKIAAALTALVIVVLAGCADDDPGPEAGSTTTVADEPRPLTGDEAQRLSMMRYGNYTTGVRSVEFEVVDGGRTFTVDGWVDFVGHVGYANVSEDGGDPLLAAWTASSITSHEPAGPATDDGPPLPPPDDAAWTSSTLAPAESRLHATLAVVLQAGNDRPDNALLLQQTDARWLRSDELAGVTVDVVAGPTEDRVYDPATSTAAGDGSDATLRYWVDGDSVLRRMEVRLGGAGDWTVIDLGDAAAEVSFADEFLATTTGG
ncbi:hypothetical protein [Jiangella asiatica]|uniref:LppX_LprAFG lipoprotein n=1 Tax=Jiangella asiatica TaxID=2530372 RepID=A0A4R5CQ01_9ACTN|nr:hypothetical protein [Jiangella asiatica]TDE02559.1 hypothetical protein E1269_21480 [Jiangella asiatica]